MKAFKEQSFNKLRMLSDDKYLSYDFFDRIPDVREEFLQNANVITLKKGDFLFHEGDVQYTHNYLLEGRTAIIRISHSGQEFILYIHKNGWLFPSAGNGHPRIASAQALQDCRLMSVNSRYFRSLITKFPKLIDAISHRTHIMMKYCFTQYISVFIDDAETRLKKFIACMYCDHLLCNSEIRFGSPYIINLSQSQLASSIGVSRVMINKILHKMHNDGFVNISYRKIHLIEPLRLLKYIEF